MSIEAFTYSAQLSSGERLPQWFSRGSAPARQGWAKSQPGGVACALSDATARNRARAARQGVRLACHATGEILSLAAHIDCRDRLAKLLSRAIGAAQRGSMVTCEASIDNDEARCHLRFAVEACKGPSSHLAVEWIDELWSWPAPQRVPM